MWQLIANGLNLIGNIFSIRSFISGFSLDKNIKLIEKSILNIENQLNDYGKLFSDIGKPEHLENYLDSLSKANNNSTASSDEILSLLKNLDKTNNGYFQNMSITQRKLIDSLSRFITDIKNSYHFTKNQDNIISNSIIRDITRNPFDAGISQYWDVSTLNNLELFPNKIINNQNTPILWSNPYNGNKYLGEIHNNQLLKYGINLKIPHYKYNQDGFIYNADKGLYLPHLYK